MELYIHIPFCIRKCAYCDFLSAPADAETWQAYTEALLREIRLVGAWHAGLNRNGTELTGVSSVFIGGGTPSVIPAGDIERILQAVRENFLLLPDAEISMESNPGTLTAENLSAYLAAGVNRLSIGLQSADNEELKLLGRIHTWEEFLEGYQAARRAGFANINIDLMSGLPGQSPERWERTLEQVIALNPEHISAYSLIIEEGTPFYARYAEHPELLPDEETDRDMYHRTREILAAAGYERYEISNYAKPGYACRHNEGYWKRIPYLGLGIGAASLYQERRFRNVSDLGTYLNRMGVSADRTGHPETEDRGYREPDREDITACLEAIREEEEILTAEDQMAEFMFLGLRRMAGICSEEFQACFGRTPEEVYAEVLDRMVREGLMEQTKEGYRLTLLGIDVSNVVFAEFL